MMLRLALRGFIQVAPVGASTTFIAAHNILGAAICGFAISYVWYGNVNASVRQPTCGAAVAYASGAMLGTLAGMLIAGWVTAG